MELELKIKDRIAKVNQKKNNGNKMKFTVDDKEYELDLVRLAVGLYSVIYNGKSYNIQMVQGSTNKHFTVNTFYNTYEVEVIDAESKYKYNRQKVDGIEGGNSIFTPMPGKVVKIYVQIGDEVDAGQTIIVVSAMKMESEFKAAKAGKVKAIHVKEGELVEGNKVMVIIE
jgi:biotin carboxyl carrier protein